MTGPVRLILAAARRLAPPERRLWADAAAREAGLIADRGAAFRFALGLLFWTLREAAVAQVRNPLKEHAMPGSSVPFSPRAVGVACALAATALGVVYMASAGAPLIYPLLNVAAAAFGLVGLAILGLAERRGHLAAGPVVLALGLTMLAVALWGVESTGVRRWLSLGGLVIQPALIAVPLMLALFARSRDGLSTFGLMIAAAALAVQPDRGVAGPLAAALAALVALRPRRREALALAAAVVAFVVTLVRPDASPAVPYVDRVLHTAFDAGWAAGVAVLAGSALLVLPGIVARRLDPATTAFGILWAGLIAAAALANHPTPLVGYGGSAVVGYLLSLIALSARPARAPVGKHAPAPAEQREPPHASPLVVLP